MKGRVERGVENACREYDGYEDCCEKDADGSFTNIHNSTATETIGSSQSNGSAANFINALIDDVRIYNRALSADEVKRLYQLGSGR